MKKLFILIIVGLLFASCNVTKEVSSKAFPEVYQHVEFYHSGQLIRSYDSVKIEMIKANVAGLLQSEYYLLFVVKDLQGKKLDTIMDSDTLSLVWK